MELTIVMPCFNEMSTIEKVVRDWVAECDRLGIEFEFRIYDASSVDGTVEAVTRLAAGDSRIRLLVEPGLPHGASCIRGYKEAEGDWVFQIDSDDEMGPASFEKLWSARQDYDLLVGCREGRSSQLARRVVTWGARLSLAVLFRSPLRDANSPYRLMRRTVLQDVLPSIPEDTLAPNVIVSGLLSRRNVRIYEVGVPHTSRLEGTAAGLKRWKLFVTAFRCFRQTVSAAARG